MWFVRKVSAKIFLVFIVLSTASLADQASRIDSLKQILRNTTEGETVDIMNQLSEVHAGVDWEKSRRYGSLALDLAGSLHDKYGMAVAHSNLAKYYNQAEQYREALDHANLALSQFENVSDDRQIAQTFRTIGDTYRLLNQSDQSLDYFLRALMIFEDIDRPQDVALTVIDIGNVFSQWGQTEKALRFYERALSIYEKQQNYSSILNSENLVAHTLMVLLRFKEASDHLDHALRIADEHQQPAALAKLYTSLGELYYYMLQLNTAQKYFMEALDLKRKTAEPTEIAIALSDVGSIYQEAGEISKALKFYQEGQALAEQTQDIAISAEIYLQIGELYLQSGQLDKAVSATLTGLNNGHQINDLQLVERANELLTEAYSRFGQPAKALNYQKALQLTRDELNQQRSSQRVAELEVRYDLDKRERELADLKSTALAKDIEYKRQFTVLRIVIAFSGAIILLIIAFAVYRSRLIRRTEQEKMEHALRLKADFTAMLVHDLRSPLTSVFGFAELLKMGEKPYARIREIAITIRATSQKMLQLVNEMLDLSKFEAGKMILNKSEMTLKPLVKTSLQMLEPVAQQKEKQISLMAEDGLPTCTCDGLKIEQVITNFISNAIEHTPEGAQIKVQLEEFHKLGQSYLRFSVADNGPGVALEQQQKIFDKYAQLQARGSDSSGGTGLGLAVSQMIIEQHGGTIGYRDREPSGSIFFFELPCKLPEQIFEVPPDTIQAEA